LLNAPRWVYVALIAAERGSVSTRRTEAKALEEFLSGYKTRSPLVKEIIAGQEEADDKLGGSLKEAERMLGQVGTLLERKVGGDEGDAVRDLLMQAGEAVAEATREALIGDAESAKEEKALALIETALKATDADKRRRREEAAAAEAKRRAQLAREAEARAAAERKREEATRAEAEKKAKEAEAKRKAAEAEAKRKAAEAEAKRKAAEAEAERRAAEAEAKRRAREAEAKRRAEEAEAQKKAAEAEAQKKAAEAEAQKAAEAAAAAAEAERIYVVKPGDTLSHIALEMYGNAGRWREIFEANRDVIKKPNLIRPGWKLRIPD
jgi:nucleoid-associated protein YgaU